MTDLQMYQSYWWLLIAVLGAALVFMLFVLGGQSMLLSRLSEQHRQLMVNSIGRKWELTFTSLVVFGGAFFASFPLFYSTSFGGAYWLWMSILFCFIFQAVCYEFRRKRGISTDSAPMTSCSSSGAPWAACCSEPPWA